MKTALLNRLQQLSRVSEADLWHVLMICLALSDETVVYHAKYLVCIAGVVGLTLNGDVLWQRISHTVYALVLLFCLIIYYYTAANHYFGITYFAVFLCLRQWDLIEEHNYGFGLVVLIITLATIQKFLSPTFINGSFTGLLFLSGESLQWLNDRFFDGFEAYRDFFNQQLNTLSNNRIGKYTMDVQIPDGFIIWSKAFGWFITLAELVLVVILVFKKNALRYWAMFVFLWGTVFFRKEYTFFATLCFLLTVGGQMEGRLINNLLRVSFFLFLIFGFLGLFI